MSSAARINYAEDSILEPNAQESWRRLADTVDTLLLETRATELITDESGAVIGVKAESYDGTKITAYGKAVVVATGGYMGNAEMQEEYNHATFSTAFAMAQDTGDGLQMMWNVGANKFHIGGESNHITQPAGEVKGFDDLAAMIPHTLHCAPCLLNVNRYGQRWRGEDVLETVLALIAPILAVSAFVILTRPPPRTTRCAPAAAWQSGRQASGRRACGAW